MKTDAQERLALWRRIFNVKPPLTVKIDGRLVWAQFGSPAVVKWQKFSEISAPFRESRP